jgi:hypothetical protein
LNLHNLNWKGGYFSIHDSIPVGTVGNPVLGCPYPYQTGEFVLEVWMGRFNVGLNELDEKSDWTVYPNPAYDKLTIDFAQGMAATHVRIVDLLGKEILTKQTTNQKETITLPTGLQNGVFFVEISNGTNVLHREKVIIANK